MSRGPRLTPEKKARILEALKTMTAKQVAAELGVCEASVFKVKREAKAQTETV